MSWKWRILILAGLFVLALAAFVLRTFWLAGQFKTITPHFAGRCTLITGLLSSEDIAIDQKTGLAFISAADRRPAHRTNPGQGAIYALDLTRPDSIPVNLTPKLPFSFQPHGIGLWRRGDEVRLFVVNHRGGCRAGGNCHRIEVFLLSGLALKHIASIKSDLLNSPNDVAPLDGRRFYVSNDHGSTGALGLWLEDYLQLPRSNVLYYNGANFQVAAEDLRYANGLALSKNADRLYVAETLGFGISVFKVDPIMGRLKKETFIEMGTGVDNIEPDPQGNLWVGAHPKLFAFVDHARDPSRLSPSQVLKILPWPPGYKVQEVYLSKGRPLSGSSAAAVWGRELLIGAVVQPGLLRCRLP